MQKTNGSISVAQSFTLCQEIASRMLLNNIIRDTAIVYLRMVVFPERSQKGRKSAPGQKTKTAGVILKTSKTPGFGLFR